LRRTCLRFFTGTLLPSPSLSTPTPSPSVSISVNAAVVEGAEPKLRLVDSLVDWLVDNGVIGGGITAGVDAADCDETLNAGIFLITGVDGALPPIIKPLLLLFWLGAIIIGGITSNGGGGITEGGGCWISKGGGRFESSRRRNYCIFALILASITI